MLEALKTLEPFRNMDTPALSAAATHARMLRLPPQRTLLRAGQESKRDIFLHKGTVTIRLGSANRRLDAVAAAGKALNAHDADEIVTLTPVEAISVDRAVFTKPVESPPPTPEEVELRELLRLAGPAPGSRQGAPDRRQRRRHGRPW